VIGRDNQQCLIEAAEQFFDHTVIGQHFGHDLFMVWTLIVHEHVGLIPIGDDQLIASGLTELADLVDHLDHGMDAVLSKRRQDAPADDGFTTMPMDLPGDVFKGQKA